MDDIFNTPGNVDPSLFTNDEGNSTNTEAENEANATQEVQTEQTTEQVEAPIEDTPKLYAGKYKTPEEMEKAYTEVQKLMTRQAQELAQFKAPKQDTPKQQEQPKQEIDWYAAFQQDPVNTMAYMANMIAEEKLSAMQSQYAPISQEYAFQKELNEIQSKYPDFNQHTDGIVKVLEEMPEIGNLPNKLDVAYRIAKGNAMTEQAQTAYQAGQQDALKLDAQKAGKIFDNKTNKPEAQPTIEEQVFNSILGAKRSMW